MAGCGGCQPGDSPTHNVWNDTSPFVLTLSSPRRMRGRWDQVLFPMTPCTNPHLMNWEYRVNAGPWKLVNKNTNPVEAYFLPGYVPSILADGNVNYDHWLTFALVTGLYEFKITRICGPAFDSSIVSVAVVLPPPGGSNTSGFLQTGADIL